MKLLLSLILLLNFAYAGTEGGGGDVVILPDGSVVLADAYLDRNAPQPNNMPKQIALNPKLILNVKVYTQFLRKLLENSNFLKHKRSDILNLFDILGTHNNNLAFYSVQDANELNQFCASGGRKVYKLEDGYKVEQVACTSGNEVYLVTPLFRRMNIVQQTLLLFHERLTTFRDRHGGKNYQAIAGLTSGLYTILQIAYEQQQGTKRLVTDAEFQRIQNFYMAVFELEYRDSPIPIDALDYTLHRNGGGMIKKGASVDENAFVGITSVIMPGAEISAGAFIRNTVIPEYSIIEAEARLDNVIMESRDVRIQSGADLKEVTMNAAQILVGNRAKILRSTLKAASILISDSVQILRSRVDLGRYPLVINAGEKLMDGEITAQGNATFAPLSKKIKNIAFTLELETDCKGSINDVLEEYDRSLKRKNCFFKSEDVKSWQVSFPGGVIDFRPTEVEEFKLRRKDIANHSKGTWLTIFRKFELKFRSMPSTEVAPSELYVLNQGKIEKAGASHVLSLRADLEYEQNQAVKNKLKELGVTSTPYGNERLPYEN